LREVRRQARGFVLVVVLGLLVLAATLLVAIGRASVSHSLAARLEQAELQQRWGAVSCRNAILPAASDIIAIQERLRGKPIPVLRTSVELSGLRYTLIISDEQAKANINALLERVERSGVEGRVRDAVAGSGLGNSILLHPEPLPPRDPRPASRPNEVLGPPQWITGFGQVFADVSPARLLSGTTSIPIEQLTCWGSGAINLMRVSEPALHLACSPQLTSLEAGRLIDARNAAFAPQTKKRLLSADVAANSDAATALLAQAHVDPKVRRTVAFTTNSTCFSLWIVTQNGRRASYRLFVSDQSNPQHPHEDSFAW
jgi:hypothetical protein